MNRLTSLFRFSALMFSLLGVFMLQSWLLYDKNHVSNSKRIASADSLINTPAWKVESNMQNAALGTIVSHAGDVNGDGYSDIIIGATGYRNFANYPSLMGRTFVYHSTATGLNDTAATYMFQCCNVLYPTGYASTLAGVGDVNGDGYDDVMVGEQNADQFFSIAHLYLGSVTGVNKTAARSLTFPHARFGGSIIIAAAGDVNGDGFSDVIIRALVQDMPIPGYPTVLRAYILHGSATGLLSIASWRQDVSTGAPSPSTVAAAGDVNGDGFGDVIIGFSLYSNSEAGEGAARVYLGSAAGLSTTASWSVESNQAGAGFGIAVTSAGDVNKDGYGDVIIGANKWDISSDDTNEGRVYLYLGSATGLSNTAGQTIEGSQPNSDFGWNLADAGDVNGDGYGDVVIGARNYTNNETAEGAIYLYTGSSTGLRSIAMIIEGNQANAHFGTSVANAGDINKDSLSDVMVGAPGYSNGEAGEGATFVYYGKVDFQGPLPLHLSDFTGKLSNHKILLNWSTTNETNIKYFAIKRSTDGRNFTEIASVKSKNNPSGNNSYSFEDTYVITGKIYYRLEILDGNGKITNSNIVILRNINSTLWTVSPNPVKSSQFISLGINNVENKKAVRVEITDVTGRVKMRRQLQLVKDYQTFNIPVHEKGTYFIRLTGFDELTNVKKILVH